VAPRTMWPPSRSILPARDGRARYLFRMEDVLPRPHLAPAPRGRSRPALHAGLFLLTAATTLWAGFLLSPAAEGAPTLDRIVAGGLPFSASLLGILFCHEMGHFVLARRHGVDVTLPYFIPSPIGIGTFGAVIRIRSAMPSRSAAFDIGAAGPLAGFAVALPLLIWGLAHSEVRALAAAAHGGAYGSPFELVRALLAGRPLEAAGSDGPMVMGDSLLTWLVARVVVGPLPPGHDVFLHPVAFAAWLGMLVTALNLIPAGQLDGGHVLYALLGRARAEAASRLVSRALLLAGLFLSWSWMVWWLLTRLVVGVRHPPALVEEPLGSGRRLLAFATLGLLALVFVPVPVSF